MRIINNFLDCFWGLNMVSLNRHLERAFAAGFAGEKKDGVDFGALYRQRMVDFRAEPQSVARVDAPSNLSRAHQLGYKAKKGFVIARVRIRRGSGLHRRPYRGRRPKQMGVRKRTRGRSIQSMAELRASRKFPNCEVLNSYWVGQDGQNKFFEVILVDKTAPEIVSDRSVNWLASSKHRRRVARGLTSQGKKSRGLRYKGKGVEKHRPSLRAHNRQAK